MTSKSFLVATEVVSFGKHHKDDHTAQLWWQVREEVEFALRRLFVDFNLHLDLVAERLGGCDEAKIDRLKKRKQSRLPSHASPKIARRPSLNSRPKDLAQLHFNMKTSTSNTLEQSCIQSIFKMEETPQACAFHLFPNLPPELRDKIWLHALPSEPRLIPYAASTTPSIATVNRESRMVFLSVYTKCFLPFELGGDKMLGYPISPYSNLSLDILLISRDIMLEHDDAFPMSDWMTVEGVQGLKHVAVCEEFWVDVHRHLSEHKNVETLAMLVTWISGAWGEIVRNEGHLIELCEQQIGNYGFWLEQRKERMTQEFKSLKVTVAEIEG